MRLVVFGYKVYIINNLKDSDDEEDKDSDNKEKE